VHLIRSAPGDGGTLVLNSTGQPGSNRDAIGTAKGRQLLVSVAASPAGGRATDHLVRLLAEESGVPIRDIDVVPGRCNIRLPVRSPKKLPSRISRQVSPIGLLEITPHERLTARGSELTKNTLTSYTDDATTREALRKVGSERTLHEIYGLFYGGMAAPDPADPKEYLPVIFEKDEPAAPVSEEDAKDLRDNLLSLWNFIARWKPDRDPFYFPEQEYPDNYQGVLQHLTDDASLLRYFVAGLNLGGTEEDDFSPDAVDALHELTEASERLEKNITVCAALNPTAGKGDPDSAAQMLDEIEETIAGNIARVFIGLKDAKR
jgi:uncharacterized protein YggU (UPF0235/DUF167 family)